MSDPLSPEARAIVEAARPHEGATSADRERIRGALARAIGGGAIVAGSSAVPSTAAASSGGGALALKMAAVVAVVGAVSGTVVVLEPWAASDRAEQAVPSAERATRGHATRATSVETAELGAELRANGESAPAQPTEPEIVEGVAERDDAAVTTAVELPRAGDRALRPQARSDASRAPSGEAGAVIANASTMREDRPREGAEPVSSSRAGARNAGHTSVVRPATSGESTEPPAPATVARAAAGGESTQPPPPTTVARAAANGESTEPPSPTTVVSTAQAPGQAAGVTAPPEPRPPVSVATVASDRARELAPPPSIEEEVTELGRAVSARAGGRPAHALRLLEEHRRRYPRSALASERLATRILALCDLGRDSEAARLGERFLAEHPRSPLAARIRSSCAGPR